MYYMHYVTIHVFHKCHPCITAPKVIEEHDITQHIQAYRIHMTSSVKYVMKIKYEMNSTIY